jgi:hypothetical protein
MTISPEQLLVDIYTAYLDARRHKRHTHNQLRFEINVEEEVQRLFETIAARTYVPRRSVAFMVYQPVKREVFCADFADRVVHHVIFNYVNPIFEQVFIPASFSCRKGKGTLYGVRTMQQQLEQCTEGHTKEAYILKLDIRGYFMGINRQRLYDKVEQTLLQFRYLPVTPGAAETWNDRLDYELVLFLLRQVIFTDPVEGCFVKGDRKDWEGFPPSKSLFSQNKGVGLPIGNLTSQLFSNIYLNRFDHWVIKELGCPYYGRYVDDFYIIHQDPDYLKGLIPVIKDHLKVEFGLTLHPNKLYFQNSRHGCSFLGAYIKGKQCFAGRRLSSNFKKTAHVCKGDELSEQQVVARMNSYLGLLQHHSTYKLRKKVVERFNEDKRYVVCGGYKKIKMKK